MAALKRSLEDNGGKAGKAPDAAQPAPAKRAATAKARRSKSVKATTRKRA